MADVSDDRDRQWREVAFVLADRQRVEQALGGMGVAAGAARQHAHMGLDVACDQVRDLVLGIAQHQYVDVQRFERAHGVEHALALQSRRELHFHACHVGTEAARRQFETQPRASGRLGKQRRNRDVSQRVAAGQSRADLPHEVLCSFEDPLEHRDGQAVERQQVPQAAVRAQLRRAFMRRVAHRSPSPFNQRSTMIAAAALSTSPRRVRPLRPAWRDARSPDSASSEE